MKIIFIISYVFFAFIISAYAGELYICIDRNGNEIITNSPQDGMKNCVSKGSKEGLSAQESVGKKKSESNNNSALTNRNEQPTGSSSAQPIGHHEEVPPPYNCIKICVQDSRNARKACKGDRDEYHRCMKENNEQLSNCRKKCHEEENYIESNHDIEKNNVKTSNSHEASAEASTSLLHTVKFDLVDQRDPAEREGYPYPKSWFTYVMHGDQSLHVDRLSILKTKLIERFGSKLEGKIIILLKFYVMEAIVGPKVPPAKETDKGPYLPTLISEISMKLDGNYFSGEAFFRLRQGSRSTKSALTLATTMAVDDLLKDIERRWKGNINLD